MTVDDDPGLPIKLGPCSNGEYVPKPPSRFAREVAREFARAITLLGPLLRDGSIGPGRPAEPAPALAEVAGADR